MQSLHIPPLPPGVLGWLALGTVVFLFLTLFAQKRPEGEKVNVFGKFFLVMLRITIGWHCLVEGLDKLHNPSWSSEPYLREATGPLAWKFREIAGDRVLDELTVADEKKLPPALDADWQRYFDAFASHYKLDDAQKTKAADALDKAKQKTIDWVAKPQKVMIPSLIEPKDAPIEIDVKERIERYREHRKKADDLEAELMTRYHDAAVLAEEQFKDKQDRTGERFRNEKVWQTAVWADWLAWKKLATDERASLKKDLDAQASAMKDALFYERSGRLAKAQRQGGAGQMAKDLAWPGLTDEQKKMAPIDEPVRRPIDWSSDLDRSDVIVSYGLAIAGGCLILGAFTPLACLVAGVFLGMFYLAMPAFPWLPEGPKAEGHYLYINKNIIEMCALFALRIPADQKLGRSLRRPAPLRQPAAARRKSDGLNVASGGFIQLAGFVLAVHRRFGKLDKLAARRTRRLLEPASSAKCDVQPPNSHFIPTEIRPWLSISNRNKRKSAPAISSESSASWPRRIGPPIAASSCRASSAPPPSCRSPPPPTTATATPRSRR